MTSKHGSGGPRPKVGILIVPLMPAADVVLLAREADRIGYDYCLMADEGLHPDVYACLGAAALATDKIVLGPMTNPYTRHPAAGAAALATVNALSDGRAIVTMLTGGSMTLAPMGITRTRPHRALADAVEVMRALWSGKTVTWQGQTCALDAARLGLGPQDIPIWIAGRGPMLLGLAGERADGVVLTVKPDLGAALALVTEAARQADREPPSRIYLGRVCYTPALLEGQSRTLSYVLMDSPQRVLSSLGFGTEEIEVVRRAVETNRPDLVDPLVTDELLRRYQVAGTPAECTAQLTELRATQNLDVVLIDVLSADLEENIALIHESYPILTGTPT